MEQSGALALRGDTALQSLVEDVRSGAVMNGNAMAPTYFQQYWSFSRDAERGWVLDEIQQASEAQYHETAPIVDDDTGPPAGAPPPGTRNN